ncbi:quinone oxidoreductase family protein [Merismopedia glauca]|uniref:Quinone oxidoreductase n=1 Tax=Merismopedia glauca CCAP 1448/3 TaxID=1296344 RepID=A0A2T1C1X2_9CYAN|nr:quinone oxidoreductase [Merismopedia glauca]PSB02113.1 quinone oxidoreductase [Merismopedia glauca CCAP 1448/3]
MPAIRVYQPGIPEVMLIEDTSIPQIKDSEVLVANRVAGVNGKDLLIRDGTYSTPLPYTPGIEGAGVVVEKGKLVTNFQIGERVAYCHAGSGSYAEYTAVEAEKVISIPETIDDETAGACLVQGLAAHYLTHSTFPLEAGHTALIHAAAGGVGLLTVQMAKLRGAKVIGTVSSPEKARIAQEAGADEIVMYSQDDFETETMRLTQGIGVDVVYDSVGAATFDKSLNVLKNRGVLVLLGQASGSVPPFDLTKLSNQSGDRGSFYLSRPTTRHYIQGDAFQKRVACIFDYIKRGQLKVFVGQRYQLSEAIKAHQDLSSRRTVGKSLLIL